MLAGASIQMMLAACTAVSAAMTSPASPHQAGASPYSVDVLVDGTTTAAMFGFLAISEGLVKPGLAGGLVCTPDPTTGRCSPNNLNSIDRSVIGNHSQAWGLVSDVGMSVTALGAVGGTIADTFLAGHDEPWAQIGADTIVVGQSMAVATLLTQVVKFAVRRPRPTQYSAGRSVASVEHQLSFPSGHVAAVSAGTTAYARTFAWRHPGSAWIYAVAAGVVATTALTAYGRVGSGMHFYSDVVAGALVGTTTGLVIPYLHRTGAWVSASVPPAIDGERRAGLQVVLGGQL